MIKKQFIHLPAPRNIGEQIVIERLYSILGKNIQLVPVFQSKRYKEDGSLNLDFSINELYQHRIEFDDGEDEGFLYED